MSGKVLDNGLAVFAMRTPARGLVTVDIKVLAGPSQEGRFLGSGIGHLVEHMLFKGTKTRKPGDIEREVKSCGGSMNGSVSWDLADYHITVPADKLPQALSILKDMLTNATFEPAEIEREREVIRNEIKLANDDPQRRVLKILNATTYRIHPYRHPPIGYEDLLDGLGRDDLVAYYESRYVPNRMVIAVAGGIEPSLAIAAVEKEFTGLRRADYGGVVTLPQEPRQMDRRFREDTAETTLGYIGLGYHSTELTHEDLYALDVLAMILGRGDTSRLNTALYKQKQLAYAVSAWNYTPRDKGLFVITATVSPDKADQASRAILEEVERLKSGDVSDDELEGARRTAQSDLIFALETTEGRADDITANAILTGSPGFSTRYVEGIRSVTKGDIRRVANRYLDTTNLSEVRLMPRATGGQGPASGPETDQARAAERFVRSSLDNGLRVIVRRNNASPSVSITVAMLGGVMVEDAGSNGISSMVSRMLFKGSKTRDESQILGAIQRMGATADSFSGISSFGFTITCLKDDVPAALAIARDILIDPTFPEDELAKEKRRTIAMIDEEDDDLFENGFRLLKKAVFPDSPYGMRYLGEKASVSAMDRQALVDFHRAYCAAGTMVIAFSGDIDPSDAHDQVRALFARLGRSADAKGPAALPDALRAPVTEAVTMEKEGALVLEGFRSVSLADPGRYALDMASSILSGQSGRMFAELRGRRSLAYALGCAQKLSMNTGFFAFYVATSHEKVPEVRAALAGQIAAIRTGPVTDAEMAMAFRELATGHRVDLQSNKYVSSNGALEELYGDGRADAIFSYEDSLAKVTADDVMRAAERYLDPERSATVLITRR